MKLLYKYLLGELWYLFANLEVISSIKNSKKILLVKLKDEQLVSFIVVNKRAHCF